MYRRPGRPHRVFRRNCTQHRAQVLALRRWVAFQAVANHWLPTLTWRESPVHLRLLGKAETTLLRVRRLGTSAGCGSRAIPEVACVLAIKPWRKARADNERRVIAVQTRPSKRGRGSESKHRDANPSECSASESAQLFPHTHLLNEETNNQQSRAYLNFPNPSNRSSLESDCFRGSHSSITAFRAKHRQNWIDCGSTVEHSNPAKQDSTFCI